jgi:hypothetical protein
LLDFTLKNSEDRVEQAKKELREAHYTTPSYLENMTDYILKTKESGQTKYEKKQEYQIITNNREVTIAKRQQSLDEITSNPEVGEDRLYVRINPDKNQLLDHREDISAEDIDNMPIIADYLITIGKLKKSLAKAEGKTRYQIKKQIMEMWQQIYLVKSNRKCGKRGEKILSSIKTLSHVSLNEDITLDDSTGMPKSNGLISLFNKDHIRFLLKYYQQLKQECYTDLDSDMRWLLLDLENLCDKAIGTEGMLYDLLVYKIDKMPNEEIATKLNSTYNANHSEQYYSTVWTKRIPKLIAEEAIRHYLVWYYLQKDPTKTNKYYWYKCGRCGEVKPLHPFFYGPNGKSKYYSICRKCRTKTN